jgi:phage recombination protein Bet
MKTGPKPLPRTQCTVDGCERIADHNEISATPPQQPRGLVQKVAQRFGVDPLKMLETLKLTAFKQSNGAAVSNEQMMALLIVADTYGLNPFLRELFAFPDKGGIVPVVSVDGWSRILNDHPQMDGVEFVDAETMTKHSGKDVPEWIECVIYRKDRSKPTRVRERFAEVSRDTQPWKSHPARMLRHKALIQCARVAFGFSGIFDEDEAQRIANPAPEPARIKAQAAQAMLTARSDDAEFTDAPEIIGETTGDVLVADGEQ